MRGCAIKQISCGSNHTLAVSTKSKVFAWGYGDNGSLGHGKVDGDLLFPAMIREKELKTSQGYSVAHVEAGGQHSCLILNKESSRLKTKVTMDPVIMLHMLVFDLVSNSRYKYIKLFDVSAA